MREGESRTDNGRMALKRKIVLAASVVAGVIAALLTRAYVAACENDVKRERDALLARYGTINVLCFKHDVPAGTVLSRDDLGQITVPEMGLRGQAVLRSALDSVLGRKILLGHSVGDVLFWADVEGGNPRDLGLSADVKRQMRAISIGVGGTASVSGMVRPNDHVDVIGTFSFPREDGVVKSGDIVTCTILQNVLVLATGKDTAKVKSDGYGSGQGYAMVTLEVTPREAEMIAFAEQMKGRLILTLRNRNDTSYEKELPQVDFEKIRGEIEELNLKRQQKMGGR